MSLIVIWIIFIIFVGFSTMDLPHYSLFSLAMLYLTYIHDEIIPVRITPRIFIFFSAIPSGILWYIAYVCNDFLWVHPIKHEFFVALFLVYTYTIIFIVCECDQLKTNRKKVMILTAFMSRLNLSIYTALLPTKYCT
jgi:hypothetical protein